MAGVRSQSCTRDLPNEGIVASPSCHLPRLLPRCDTQNSQPGFLAKLTKPPSGSCRNGTVGVSSLSRHKLLCLADCEKVRAGFRGVYVGQCLYVHDLARLAQIPEVPFHYSFGWLRVPAVSI